MPSLPGTARRAFGVCQDLTGGEALASYQSLYLAPATPRLHRNAFRGVRAISKFDWPFTPTLSSSRSFSTLIGSALIQKLFNAYWFGPPYGVTHTSAWPRVDHLVSRLPPPTKTPCSDSLSLRLRVSRRLTSPATATRRFIMQKARRHTRVLRPLVGAWFQGLFHSPVRSAFHLSLTVLVRYRSLGSI